MRRQQSRLLLDDPLYTEIPLSKFCHTLIIEFVYVRRQIHDVVCVL